MVSLYTKFLGIESVPYVPSTENLIIDKSDNTRSYITLLLYTLNVICVLVSEGLP